MENMNDYHSCLNSMGDVSMGMVMLMEKTYKNKSKRDNYKITMII